MVGCGTDENGWLFVMRGGEEGVQREKGTMKKRSNRQWERGSGVKQA